MELTVERSMSLRKSVLSFFLLLLLLFWGRSAQAQFANTWLGVGEMWHHYNAGGMESFGSAGTGGSDGLDYPAIIPYANHDRVKALYIGTRDFTDRDGNEYPFFVAHQGHLNDKPDQFFPQQLELVHRFERPQVTVDGRETSRKVFSVDRVDPDMKADGKIVNTTHTLTGVTVDRTVRAFSNEYHDNYHIIEYEFTNTGHTDGDGERDLNQTLEDVYIYEFHWPTPASSQGAAVEGGGIAWGEMSMTDFVGFGEPDFTDQLGEDVRGYFMWHGYNPEFQQWDNIGAPAMSSRSAAILEEDSTGFLAGSNFQGRFTFHADGEPRPADASDESAPFTGNDLSQPYTMGVVNAQSGIVGTNQVTSGGNINSQYNDLMAAGRPTPHHADQVAGPQQAPGDWRERMAYATNRDPSLGLSAGVKPQIAYGPYDLEPGESVRVVEIEGLDGLDLDARRAIGRAFKDRHFAGNPYGEITYEVGGEEHSMSKNEWVMTGRDSLFKMVTRAKANYDSGYNIPSPPRPPSQFAVNSAPGYIELQWQPADETPHQWEIYRTRGEYWGKYEHLATVDGTTNSYEDSDTERGEPYFYYIQAVGDVNQDDTGMTPTGVRLKSNRYYTQTYAPAFQQRAPGESLQAARVVPNPYHIDAGDDVSWSERDRVSFLGIPGQCTIKIYTEVGELVETIEHTDGTGDESWDLTTYSNQVVVSGLYIAVIKDNSGNGGSVIRKFSIIR